MYTNTDCDSFCHCLNHFCHILLTPLLEFSKWWKNYTFEETFYHEIFNKSYSILFHCSVVVCYYMYQIMFTHSNAWSFMQTSQHTFSNLLTSIVWFRAASAQSLTAFLNLNTVIYCIGVAKWIMQEWSQNVQQNRKTQTTKTKITQEDALLTPDFFTYLLINRNFCLM